MAVMSITARINKGLQGERKLLLLPHLFLSAGIRSLTSFSMHEFIWLLIVIVCPGWYALTAEISQVIKNKKSAVVKALFAIEKKM
ncbi:MAG: hypothetical protein KAS94_14545 [Desulfobulbaceae bacterium]|nr:hypothetical protein [Desulfobulbaceae bacterium]